LNVGPVRHLVGMGLVNLGKLEGEFHLDSRRYQTGQMFFGPLSRLRVVGIPMLVSET
jgi:hypothetical protein